MPVTELHYATVTPYDPRRRAAERRPPSEPLARLEAVAAAAPPPSDPGLLTPIFRPDLTQLAVMAAPASENAAPAASAAVDDALGHLVSAVREGDLGRARAALDALETEMLVERSAGNAEAARWLSAREHLAGESVPGAHTPDNAYVTLAHFLDEDDLTL